MMKPIPFTLPDIGLREINGLVYLEDGFLIIKVRDALFGEFDKEKREIRIEPAALVQVRLDSGIFRDKLVLRPEDERLLKAIPGEHDVEVELRIWRYHRNEIRSLLASLSGEVDTL